MIWLIGILTAICAPFIYQAAVNWYLGPVSNEYDNGCCYGRNRA